MSTSATTAHSASFSAPASKGSAAKLPLMIGIVGIALTILGIFIGGPQKAAIGWLSALVFWCGISIGMLFFIMIWYIFDAGWAVVVRRQFEHGIDAFKWLGLLFVPLIVVTFVEPGMIWKWMDPNYALPGGHGTVGQDVLYVKKAGFLDHTFFVIRAVLYFAVWIGLASIFRRNSFTQDRDGDAKWTLSSRKWAAAGLALTAFSSTFAVIDWVKSIEYHWFSTMFGVWYFANSMRGALSVLAIIIIIGLATGKLRGVVNLAHMYDVGKLMFAFTVFWAYISFSQYFLIWNANIPEETFWYNIRETGDWKWIGFLILFGHFVFPFLYLLSYKVKHTSKLLAPIAIWIFVISLIDIYYNILPSKKDAMGEPYPFFSSQLIWCLTAFVGVGGIWVWSYLRSFGTQKVVPIHDPRIEESLHHRE